MNGQTKKYCKEFAQKIIAVMHFDILNLYLLVKFANNTGIYV